MPKVSIIIPVYKVEDCLQKCLDSVINQTLKDIEILCINDGSPDNCGVILEEYAKKDNRIIVINQVNQGCDAARRNGLSKATGEYIALLDSDDYVSINYYEELYNIAKKYNADMSATDQVQVHEDDKTYIKKVGILPRAKLLNTIEEKGNLIITTGLVWNKLYKKSFIDKYKIDLSTINTAAGDNYFSAVATIFANKIAITHKATYYYIMRGNSITQSNKKQKDFQVIDIYNLIYKKVEESNILQNEKIKWKNIINQRKYNDYDVYFKTMLPELKNTFKKMASDDLEYDFIVSLTSYPKRINVVHEVIESLFGQTFKVKKIVLWLAESQFPNREKDLPKNLLDLNEANFNFEIGWCEDLRSYKKLIPTLKKYPNTVIITVDDDLIYDKTMIEKLYKTHLKYPKDIICHRAHYILFNKKKIKPYKEWLFDCQCKKASFNLFQTGAGAVLYPIGCFYKDITNATLFKNLSFDTDDIWFWAMSVLNNTKIRFANKNISSLNYIAGTQNDGLCINNVDNGNNDKNIQKVLNHYPLLLKKLEKTDMLCNNVLEKVFSVKNNQQSCHKIFTILGIQLKFKSRKLFERKKFNYMENTLRLQEEKLNRQFEYLKNNLNKKLDDNNLLLKENYYANVLRDSIQNSYWLKNKSFTLTGGAANYSFIFTLYKLLDDLNPQNILEFGLGQTTKLTTQYVNNKNINCILDVIEHNNNWINVFKQQLSVQNKNINIYQKDLIRFKLNGIESDKYDDLKDIVQNKRYDLVIIDGPFGFDRKYPRTNILDLIPNNLAESFAIILDDVERDGEKNTAQLIFNKLEQYDINYKISYKKGMKTQLLITSLNYEFIHWI